MGLWVLVLPFDWGMLSEDLSGIERMLKGLGEVNKGLTDEVAVGFCCCLE